MKDLRYVVVGLSVLPGWASTTELSQHLDDAVEVGQTRPKTIDKFVEHELAMDHVFATFIDFVRDTFQVLDLHATERLGRLAACFCKSRVGLFPLVQFLRALLLGTGHHADKFFEDFIGAILGCEYFAEQFRLLMPKILRGVRRVSGGDIDL